MGYGGRTDKRIDGWTTMYYSVHRPAKCKCMCNSDKNLVTLLYSSDGRRRFEWPTTDWNRKESSDRHPVEEQSGIDDQEGPSSDTHQP